MFTFLEIYLKESKMNASRKLQENLFNTVDDSMGLKTFIGERLKFHWTKCYLLIRRMFVWIQDSCPWLTAKFESAIVIWESLQPLRKLNTRVLNEKKSSQISLQIFSVTKNFWARRSSFETRWPKTSQKFLEEIFSVNLGQREVRFFSRTSVISIHHLRETKSISIQLLCLHQHRRNYCTTYDVCRRRRLYANSPSFKCRKRKFIRKRNNLLSSHLARTPPGEHKSDENSTA